MCVCASGKIEGSQTNGRSACEQYASKKSVCENARKHRNTLQHRSPLIQSRTFFYLRRALRNRNIFQFPIRGEQTPPTLNATVRRVLPWLVSVLEEEVSGAVCIRLTHKLIKENLQVCHRCFRGTVCLVPSIR